MSDQRRGHYHLSLVLLVVFMLVLGCAAGAVGISLIPAWVASHEVVTK